MRCGECLSIFDARKELRSTEQLSQAALEKISSNSTEIASVAGVAAETTEPEESSNDTAALDVTYSDFDIFSEEAELPEIAYFDQTRDTPDFDFNAVEMGKDETFHDTLFAHDITIDADANVLNNNSVTSEAQQNPTYAEVDFVENEDLREPLIFNYQDREQPQPHPAVLPSNKPSAAAKATPRAAQTKNINASTIELDNAAQKASQQSRSESRPWLFRVGLMLLFCVLLGALYVYRMHPQLYNNPVLRPVLEAGCNIVRCTLPARIDVASLKMVKRNVYSHPSTPNALVINVSFRNEASFAQQLPVLHMVLSNRVGRTVAKEDFSPDAYMPNWEKGAVIEANQQLDVKLEVTDPGQDAQSFEFYFREFKS